MGQLAFLRLFILVAISLDRNDNQRHVHVFYKGKRHQHSEILVAAINRHWEAINEQITRTFNGEKTISINIEK